MATIMVVDDAAFMRSKCSQLLVQNGYQVIEASNGVDAVSKYKQASPDAVLLDITMPDMDGVQALKEIIGINPNAKVAWISSLGDFHRMTTSTTSSCRRGITFEACNAPTRLAATTPASTDALTAPTSPMQTVVA